ncbi:hypothetical protein [Pseudomonas sp. EA_35y_Pfl2_R5]|uniref:hypothetical protein n=1 Tax=Pseudomonas sp. EA_35y_Pfl2_R5 TaxID=3088690 RepID=UPI0030DD456C
MAVKFNRDAARLRYEGLDIDELVRIAFTESSDFVIDAVTLAKDELSRRGVHGESDPIVLAAIEQLKLLKNSEIKSTSEPANSFILALCFIFADIFAIACALIYSSKGRKIAASEVWKAFAFGWLFRIALFIWYRVI